MSGHSKWAKIKHKKAANDAQRGQIFTKLTRAVTVAAQEGGGDPDMNFQLRLAIDQAKAENVPMANIERAIKRGTGEANEGEKIQTVMYEAFLLEQVPILILSQTDNTNRAYTDIKQTVENSLGGKMTSEGSISWQFQEKGYILLEPRKLIAGDGYSKKDEYIEVEIAELELDLLEQEGVEDIEHVEDVEQDLLEITVAKDNYQELHKWLMSENYIIRTSELTWATDNPLQLDEDSYQQLQEKIEKLEENAEVSNVWHGAIT